MKKKLKVGIIGLGKMGINHLNILSILNSVEIVFVSDLRVKNDLKKKYKVNFIKNSLRHLDKINALFITTPIKTHFGILNKILKTNRIQNIFVEKPLVENSRQINKLKKILVGKKINLKVGFIEKFNPAVQTLYERLCKDRDVISMDFFRANPISNKIKNFDIVTDLMIHDIDLAIFFNGKVKSLNVFSSFDKNKCIFLSVNLVHKNGVLSRVQTSSITQKKIRFISVTTKKKYIECNLLTKELHIYKKSKYKKNSEKNFSHQGIKETIELQPKESLLNEIISVVNNFGNNKKNMYLSSFEDSIEVMNICDQIKSRINNNN